jgi:hypothetical protein
MASHLEMQVRSWLQGLGDGKGTARQCRRLLLCRVADNQSPLVRRSASGGARLCESIQLGLDMLDTRIQINTYLEFKYGSDAYPQHIRVWYVSDTRYAAP